jgi:hypothetical protein
LNKLLSTPEVSNIFLHEKQDDEKSYESRPNRSK